MQQEQSCIGFRSARAYTSGTTATTEQFQTTAAGMAAEQSLSSATATTSGGMITPEAIRPFPVAARVSLRDGDAGPNRKKRKSVIATSSWYKAELMATFHCIK